MPTRSALALLFALLVGVPVGAAVYFGASGLGRERSMLIEQERRAMESVADQVRDRLVARLQELYRKELATPPGAANDTREPVHDRFELRAGAAFAPWARTLPRDIAELPLTE